MNVTCEINGLTAVCEGTKYVLTDNVMTATAGILGVTVLLVAVLMLLYREKINKDWRRCLSETGHEQAWMDVVKSVKKYVVPKKDDRIGGAEPD